MPAGRVWRLNFHSSDLVTVGKRSTGIERRIEDMFTFWGVVTIILDLFAINDVMKSSRDTTSKVVLLILILLFPILGAAIYLLAFRDKGF
ncbi:MAG TPA: PLDc N-terminal domain-containing protein [Blastocatellia bacterium]|nr:PLDc N-terminal domain-containing protein [Blastocatellia bacterium]